MLLPERSKIGSEINADEHILCRVPVSLIQIQITWLRAIIFVYSNSSVGNGRLWWCFEDLYFLAHLIATTIYVGSVICI